MRRFKKIMDDIGRYLSSDKRHREKAIAIKATSETLQSSVHSKSAKKRCKRKRWISRYFGLWMTTKATK